MAARYQIYKIDTSGISPTSDTLNGAINSTQTAIVLTSGTATVNGTQIKIGSEQMLVTAGGGTANLTVVRGWAQTTAASAANGAVVSVSAALTYNLLQIATVKNQGFIFVKTSTDINFASLVPFSGDTLPSSATTVMLVDASSNFGTVRMTAPGLGTQWIITAGAGAAGSGGSAAGSDENVQINKTGSLYGSNALNFDYTNQSLIITGGSTTSGAQAVIDTSASAQVSGIIFKDQGTAKWAIGRSASDVFFLYDSVAGSYAIEAFNSGQLLLSPANSLIGVTADVVPTANLSFDLGSSADYWNNLYVGTAVVEGISIVSGGAVKVLIGWNNTDAALGIVNSIAQTLFEFRVSGQNVSYWDVVPSVTSSSNLGSPSLYWNNLYVDTLNIATSIVLTSSPFKATYSATGVTLDDPASVLIASFTTGGLTVYNSAGSTIVTKADSTAGLYTTLNLSVGGSVVSSLVPSGSFNLGSSSDFWNDGYINFLTVQDITFVDPFSGAGIWVKGIGPVTSGATEGNLSFVNSAASILFEIQASGGTLHFGEAQPNGNNAYNLGDSSNFWSNLYVYTIVAPASSPNYLALTGNLQVSGSVTGLVVDGTSAVLAGTLVISGNVTGNLNPNSNNTYTLGSGITDLWAALYATNVYGYSSLQCVTGGYYIGPVGSGTQVIDNGGNWVGVAVAAGHGGTGFTSYGDGDLLVGNGSSTLSKLGIGTSGYVLTSNGSTAVWQSAGGGGGGVTSLLTLTGALTFGSNTSSWLSFSGAGTVVTIDFEATLSTWTPSVTDLSSVTVNYAYYSELPTTSSGVFWVLFEFSVTGTSNGLNPIISIPTSSLSTVQVAAATITPSGGGSAAAYANIQSGNCGVGFYNNTALASGTVYTITVSGRYLT